MTRRDLFVFLGLELVAIAVAGLAFALIASKFVAGLVAGAYFIGSAFWILNRIMHGPRPARVATLYPLLVHLFVVSIPMVTTRLLNQSVAFERVRILGLPGPAFHRLSTSVFAVLIVATLVDLARTLRAPASQH